MKTASVENSYNYIKTDSDGKSNTLTLRKLKTDKSKLHQLKTATTISKQTAMVNPIR
ncbi:MAG: hypothetical protein WBF90_06445 [Rivularia sp. (in: cyanobacteria)]|jgi:hypothetical protein